MINNTFLHTQPPYNILAEELLLGSLLLTLDHRIINTISYLVSADALMLESHQVIYMIILKKQYLCDMGLSELIYYLLQINILHKIGGIDKILELINQVATFQQLKSSNMDISSCVEVIQEKYIRRLMLQWSSYIAQISVSESIKIDFILKYANNYLQKINQLFQHKSNFSISDIMYDLLIDLESYTTNKKKLNTKGLECGFQKLDQMTQGFQPSDLIIIAGRPAMGKTSIALNITSYIIHQVNKGVVIFSFEMSKQQILYRLLSIRCKVSTHQLRSGRINASILTKVKKNCREISRSFLYIDDSPQISIFTLHIKTKKIIEKCPKVSIIIIDYLQLIQVSSLNFESRSQELSSVTRILKILAREIELPVIALSQLNRNVENRANKRPLLSDLRESGCVQSSIQIRISYYVLVTKIIRTTFYFRCFVCSVKYLQQVSENCLATISYQGLYHTYKMYIKIYTYISITNNHKVLTFIGWKREDRLQIKERSIIVHNTIMNKSSGEISLIYKNVSHIQWHRSKSVYDIKTSQFVNFIANQMIIHNSIEQDADLVLLLYRDDYYNNNSKKVAEIILAKHRNGPTGNFQLNFDSLSTNFSDN